MKNMATCNYIVSVLGILLGAAIMCAAAEFPLEFTEHGPGSGFWPFSLGTAILVAAVILLAYTFTDREKLRQQLIALTLAGNKRVYVMMGLTVVYCVLINVLGFYPASVVLIPAVMKLMDYHDKKIIAMTTVGTILFIYVIFSVLLHTQMPQSIFLE